MENKLEVKISLVGADEVIEKLKEIKKLMQDVMNTNISITIDNGAKYTTPSEVALKTKENLKELDII